MYLYSAVWIKLWLPWRFGEVEDEQGKDASWDELYTKTDAPLLARIGREVDVTAVSDPGCDQSSNAQHELLQRGDSTPNVGVSKFGLVSADSWVSDCTVSKRRYSQWNDHDKEANSQTGDAWTRKRVSQHSRRWRQSVHLPE